MNNGSPVEEIHGGHEAVFEFSFGRHADVAQDRTSDWRKKPSISSQYPRQVSIRLAGSVRDCAFDLKFAESRLRATTRPLAATLAWWSMLCLKATGPYMGASTFVGIARPVC